MYTGVLLGYTLCEGVRSPGTGVIDSCELSYGCWELNPGPLEEQPVFLTSEPSLQPPGRGSLARGSKSLHQIFPNSVLS